MNRKSRILVHEWFFVVIAWIVILNIYSWMVIANLEVFANISEVKSQIEQNIMLTYLYSGYQYLEATLLGIFFGTMFTYINFLADKTVIRKKSLGHIILIKSLLYTIAIFVSSAIIYNLFRFWGFIPGEVNVSDYLAFVTVDYVISVVVYFVFFIVLTNFSIQINRKFGPGNLFKMLLGKYSNPVNEQRIFMFLDMKGSTTIAEKLGHKKYSQFLKNCYHDLTEVVLKYKAEVYQYVGDEVVLTWKIEKGLKKLNCVKIYFAFEKALNKRKEFYERKFGVIPKFKAGMDMGSVTATEIGELKRDIAYHGDVVNTASRIQDHCNELNQNLLISEHLEEKLPGLNGFTKNYIGEINLRGKEHVVKVYGIDYSSG